MKLQRQRAYEQKGRTYYKYVVTLPPEIIERLGWKDGMQLKAVAKKGQMILQPSS